MWQDLDTSSSGSGTSSFFNRNGGDDDDSASSMTAGGGFAASDPRIRDTYRGVISANVQSLALFTQDHMRRAVNDTAAASLLSASIENSGPGFFFSTAPSGSDLSATASAPGPRWTHLTTEIIQVVNSVAAAQAQLPSSSLEGVPDSILRRIPKLSRADIGTVLSMCVRTLTLLCIVANAQRYFEAPSISSAFRQQQHDGDQEEDEQQHQAANKNKNRKLLWFEMVGSKAKKKRTKQHQLQLLAHAARMIENPEAQRDTDFPFRADELEKVVQALAASEQKQRATREALRATTQLEAIVRCENSKQQQKEPSQRRRRDDDDGNEKQPSSKNNNNKSNEDHTFTDEFGTEWSDQLRRGCSLLGGVTHHVRGTQLQLEFDLARARNEFDLPPVSMVAGPNPAGWVSRFSPSPAVFPCDGQRDPILWMHLSKEMKRFGVKERLIRAVPVLSNPPSPRKEAPERDPAVPPRLSADEQKQQFRSVSATPPQQQQQQQHNATSSVGSSQQQQQQQQLQHHHHSAPPAAGDHNHQQQLKNEDHNRAEDFDHEHAETPFVPAKKRDCIGKNPFRHADEHGRTNFHVDQRMQQPVILPCALSRVVTDRAVARSQVHDSFQRIQRLAEELRAEVAHFSECAEAAHVLEVAAPTLVDSTEKDLKSVKRVSEFLMSCCIVATAAPRLVLGMSGEAFQRQVESFFDLH